VPYECNLDGSPVTFLYRKNNKGDVHEKPTGFSWTFLIFGLWVPVLRGGEAGIVIGLLCIATLFRVIEIAWIIAPEGALTAPLLIELITRLFIATMYNQLSYAAKKRKGWITDQWLSDGEEK
jgi:hypothetical protein